MGQFQTGFNFLRIFPTRLIHKFYVVSLAVQYYNNSFEYALDEKVIILINKLDINQNNIFFFYFFSRSCILYIFLMSSWTLIL